MKLICKLLTVLAAVSPMAATDAQAISLDEVRFHNERTDTTAITDILIKAEPIKDPGQRVAAIARQFIGKPYAAHTLEGEPEMLTVNLDSLDCTTFVETVMALAYTAGESRTSWRDFIYNLERLRYRDGELNGYPSRLHYISDWIVNNNHRGNFREVTDRMPDVSYQVKTLDFMSHHRDAYAALADDKNFEGIKNVELGYRSHRFPYIKWEKTDSRKVIDALGEGDILAFTCGAKDLDVAHLGILTMDGGKPKVIHASSSAGEVTVTKTDLREFLRRNRFTGIRVIRLNH